MSPKQRRTSEFLQTCEPVSESWREPKSDQTALDTDAGQSGEKEGSAFPEQNLTSESHSFLMWQGDYALSEGPLKGNFGAFSWFKVMKSGYFFTI